MIMRFGISGILEEWDPDEAIRTLFLAGATVMASVSLYAVWKPTVMFSNIIADQGSADIISDRSLSAMVYAWGQFIDHDLDLTPTGGTEPFNIQVPTGDPYFDPNSTGTQVIPTTRSVFDPHTGTSASNPRQQVNTITSWLDASMVYG